MPSLKKKNARSKTLSLVRIKTAILFIYSKKQHESRTERWYTHCGIEELIVKVTTWFHDKALSAKQGDAVNFCFHGHGDSNGNMYFGTRQMNRMTMLGLLRLFGSEVQVNVFVSHCYSGFLVADVAIDSYQPRNRFVAAPCNLTESHWTFKRSGPGRARNMTFSQGLVIAYAAACASTI